MKSRLIPIAVAVALLLPACGSESSFKKESQSSSVAPSEPGDDEPTPTSPAPTNPAPPKNPAPPPNGNTNNNTSNPDCPYYTSCEACINALGGGEICLDKRRFFSEVAGHPVECYKHIDTNQYDWHNCRYDHVGYSGTNPDNGRKHFDPAQDCLWAREQPGVEYDYGGGQISNPGGTCE